MNNSFEGWLLEKLVMIWSREKRPDFPTETLGDDEYYVVGLDDMSQLDNVNVKFQGVLTEKTVVEFYAAGWPWSISSRLVEEDHGHQTTLKVGNFTVYYKGPAYIRRGEKVTVWGKLKDGAVQAKKIESEDIIYQQ